MCKFCYNLGINKNKEINWNVRSCYADQNLENDNGCPSEFDGKHRNIISEQFRIQPYILNGYTMISIEYNLKTDDGLIISPFSEAVQWSYCPFCGEKLSKGEVKFADEICDYRFSIEDIEYDNMIVLKDIIVEGYEKGEHAIP